MPCQAVHPNKLGCYNDAGCLHPGQTPWQMFTGGGGRVWKKSPQENCCSVGCVCCVIDTPARMQVAWQPRSGMHKCLAFGNPRGPVYMSSAERTLPSKGMCARTNEVLSPAQEGGLRGGGCREGGSVQSGGRASLALPPPQAHLWSSALWIPWILARSTPFSSTPPPSKEPLLWVTEALPQVAGGSGPWACALPHTFSTSLGPGS